MMAIPPKGNDAVIVDLPDSIFKWLDYGDS